MAPTHPGDKSDDKPRFRPVVIAPTYNNAATLLSVLDRIVAVGVPLIIVNDGSTDETQSLLKVHLLDAPVVRAQ